MGADIISVVFAVVVIGGMGSIAGSIVTALRSASSRAHESVLSRGFEHGRLLIMAIVAARQAGRPVGRIALK